MRRSRVPEKAADEVRIRCQGRCERCGISLLNRPASIHHRKPRRSGGTSDPRIHDPGNLTVLCGSGTTGCHGHIEANRQVATEQGWLISQHDRRDPADIPVYVLTGPGEGAWIILGSDRVDLDPPF